MELQILSFSSSSGFSHHPTLSTGNLERIPALLPGQQQAVLTGSNSHCGLNSFLYPKGVIWVQEKLFVFINRTFPTGNSILTGIFAHLQQSSCRFIQC